jgi:RES domain-containing protein
MILHRLSKKGFATDMSGMGAKLNGGRWTPDGIPVIHCALSFGVAVLELLTKMSLKQIKAQYSHVELFVPDSVPVEKIDIKSLPAGWDCSPYNKKLWPIGSDWIRRNESLLLIVPSVVVDGHDSNCLINVGHPEFHQVKLNGPPRPFVFDERFVEMVRLQVS